MPARKSTRTASAKKTTPKKMIAKGKAAAKRGVAKAKKSSAAKRPLNSYMKFAQKHRAEVVKAHPTWKVTDVAKELGRRYRELSGSAKARYQ